MSNELEHHNSGTENEHEEHDNSPQLLLNKKRPLKAPKKNKKFGKSNHKKLKYQSKILF